MVKKEKSPRTAAIILAAGTGSRMGGEITKQKMNILGKSVVLRSALAFDACPDIAELVIVGRESETEFIEGELCGKVKKPYKIVVGGETRAESAKRGFLVLGDSVTHVAIHDAARCLIKPTDISRIVALAIERGAATAAARVVDTVKTVDTEGKITGNIPREGLIRTQTPQVFRTDWYGAALSYLDGRNPEEITDDNLLLCLAGREVYTVVVGEYNLKITESGDIARAELILKERNDEDV